MTVGLKCSAKLFHCLSREGWRRSLESSAIWNGMWRSSWGFKRSAINAIRCWFELLVRHFPLVVGWLDRPRRPWPFVNTRTDVGTRPRAIPLLQLNPDTIPVGSGLPIARNYRCVFEDRLSNGLQRASRPLPVAVMSVEVLAANDWLEVGTPQVAIRV